jgi:tetratricopeptide (TPR) repeat protein
LDLLPENEKDGVVIKTVRDWFRDNENWLFIYDNADDDDYAKWLEDHLPQVNKGHVLITTRSYRFRNSKTIDISVFDEAESVLFLKNRINKSGDGYEDDFAKKLADLLQHLPLALEQAGAYIFETPGVIYSDYVSLLEERGIKLFDVKNNLMNYTSTITATWEISMEKITDESAVQLFNMCAYLAPDAISYDMFIRGNKTLPESLRNSITIRTRRDDMIRDLGRYSLVNGDSRSKDILSDEKRLLSMHRLLQEVVKASFEKETKWLKLCLKLIHSVSDWSPSVKSSIFNFRVDLPHAIKVAELSKKLLNKNIEDLSDLAMIFFMAGGMCGQTHDTNMSIYCYSTCIKITEEIMNGYDNSKVGSFNLLVSYMSRAAAYSQILDYDNAIKDCNKSILIGEQLRTQGYAFDESELATAYMNRGCVYEYLKKHNEALRDKNISIEINEALRQVGKLDDENKIANAYMNRSVTYESLGMHDYAQLDSDKCIQIWEDMKREGKNIIEEDLVKAYFNNAVGKSKVQLENKNKEPDKEKANQFLGNMIRVGKRKK